MCYNPYMDSIQDTAENRLKKTLFVVEATDYERYSIWRECAKQSPQIIPVEWEQLDGWSIQVGTLAKRPVVLSTQWVKIDGFLVMFWYQCSQVTDSVMAEKWIKKYFKGTYDGGTRQAWTDAMNFGACLSAIKEAKAQRSHLTVL